MSEILDTLAALKTIFQSLDPSPADPPVAVYNALVDTVSFGELPIVIVDDAANEWIPVYPASQGVGRHPWKVEISIFLEYGLITPLDLNATRAAKVIAYNDWVKAAATLLFANRSVGGTAVSIGEANGPLFRYRVGHIGRYKLPRPKYPGWGITIVTSVDQYLSLPSS